MRYLEIGPISSKKKYFIIHNDNDVGWHFLEWSIKYLSGATKNFSFTDEKYIDLVDNPIGGRFAHQHDITWVRTKEQLLDYDKLTQTLNVQCFPIIVQSGITQFNLYTRNENKENLSNLSVEDRESRDSQTTAAIIDLAKFAVELGFTLISIHRSEDHKLVPAYQIRYKHDYNSGEQIDTNAYDLWVETFFQKSKISFDSNIWDKRELLATCMRPFNRYNDSDQIIQAFPDLIKISTNDLWVNGEDLFADFDISRYPIWLKIYKQWQNLHDTKLSQDYWQILECIVKNKPMDLSCYGLDLVKEAFIQHGLIYKYNLNLRTWGLTEFPKNTSDLYYLLEENFHELDFVYKTKIENF